MAFRLYVGIVGSRRRDSEDDYELTLAAFKRLESLSHFARSRGRITVVSGGCSQGGDRFAELIAQAYELEMIIHHPDRTTHQDVKQPLRATLQNYARNELIARDARDYLIACVAADRKGGTEDTIRRWKHWHGGEPVLV